MKILAVSDVESRLLWDHFQSSYLDGIDLILSAGDLSAEYLSFLVTMAHVPVVYVPGNHDGSYHEKPPEGCINADGKLLTVEGVRILGLGGSSKYNQGPYQYTEREMRMRALRLTLDLKRRGGFDILLTHAPAKGFHDHSDLAHTGFQVFNRLIDTYRPAYHVHGHIHRSYGRDFARSDLHGETTVINACDRYVFDFPGNCQI